jgi:GTP cyclohydrolase-4
LDRVGVTNLRTIVQTRWGGHKYKFIPRIQLTVDLSGKRKGAHLSRLVEAITESIEEESEKVYGSLEELAQRILERLRVKHPYRRGEVTFETELVVERLTPKTRKRSMETHDVAVTVIKDNGVFGKKLKVRVLGNTVCPHSMKNTGGKPHIQRAVAELTVEGSIGEKISLESLIEVCEKSFSSPTYTLLKTADETEVVERMHANPKFAEDVCRGILDEAKRRFGKLPIRARVVSQESIHRHDVVAEGGVDA